MGLPRKGTTERDEGLTDYRGAGEYLRCCPATVARRVATGELTCVRIGRAVRFRREDLRQFADARATTGRASSR
jgi:excisionase family DNA binding protein